MSMLEPLGREQSFGHILRLLNTNVDGRRKIMFALTEIKGVGRRYSNLVCKKADIDLNKRWVCRRREGSIVMGDSDEERR